MSDVLVIGSGFAGLWAALGAARRLDDLLDPAGVGRVTADVTAIDTDARTVSTSTGSTHRYDRLVLGLRQSRR